jgi:hypothetical protein
MRKHLLWALAGFGIAVAVEVTLHVVRARMSAGPVEEPVTEPALIGTGTG